MWKNKNKPILFRSSGAGYLMTDAREKSNLEKYNDAKASVEKYKNDYTAIVNKETKTAKTKLAQIQKTNNLVLELEPIKNVPSLSETCKKFLVKTFAAHEHDRYEEITSKYLEKGTNEEQNAITLLSRVLKIVFKKNTVRLSDAFKSGECDLYTGPSIENAEHTYDTKCSWSLITFLEAVAAALNPIYEWQGQCYMDLYKAKKHTVAYCLVNGSFKQIMDEKYKAARQMEILDFDNCSDPKFIEKCKLIERNHIFDMKLFLTHNPHFEFHNEIDEQAILNGEPWEFDIPMEKRVHLKTFDYDPDKITALHERIIVCREFVNTNFYI